MAGGARALKRRIKVVKNTQQITKAMKMVAAAKLKVAQVKNEAATPYSDKMQHILDNLLAANQDLQHPLTQARETVKNIALVIITSDRGLCGSYNSNLIRQAQQFISTCKKNDQSVSLYCIGRRGADFFSKRDFQMIDRYTGLTPSITIHDARVISSRIKEFYTDGNFDSVYICYAKFINVVTIRPSVIQFLPLIPEKKESKLFVAKEYIFEPEADKLFNSLIPRYVDMQVYRLLIESMTSEFAARMTAMTAATDNADEVIRALTIKYNKVRQSAITAELLDIVGGANALEG